MHVEKYGKAFTAIPLFNINAMQLIESVSEDIKEEAESRT
jgi:hypothetical protein